jgi:hypothetical protein
MSDIRRLLDLVEELSEISEDITVGDGFYIECGDTLIETTIAEVTEDGVILHLDETALQILAAGGKNDRVERVNKKIKNLRENKFPKMPTREVFFNRDQYLKEWQDFKRATIDYQLKYDDGSEFSRLKMRKVTKFISESYHNSEIDGLRKVKEVLKNAFNQSIDPQALVVGNNYDVAVISLDKLSKIVEIDVHHDHIIKSVRFSRAEGTPVVTTEQGLEGITLIDKAEEIETLCFEPSGDLDKIMTGITLKMSPKYEGWTLSVISDKTQGSEDDLEEAKYHGRTVPLNKPMAGDVAKSKVYVKDPSTGNIKKVNFGQKGVKIKKSNPGRRKNFRARHNCDNPGPKTKARYWSCRMW